MGRHVGSWGGRQGEGDDHGGEWGQELEEEPGGWEERIWRGAGPGGQCCASELSFPGALAWRGTNSRPSSAHWSLLPTQVLEAPVVSQA